VCFLDDDAIACPDWLERIEQAFSEHPEAGAIGGHILLQVPEPRPRVLKEGLEPLWSQFITAYTGYTEVNEWNRFPWGANWSARRNVLLEIGGFRTGYGRRGTDYWGGEELVAAAQICSLGYKVAVLPQAQVLHNVDPSRFRLSHIWRTILASTLVAYQAQRDFYIPAKSASAGIASELRRALQGLRPSSKEGPALYNYPDIVLLRIAARLVLAFHRLRDFWTDWFHSLAPSLH
jgi:GT2 family glycosyltransferase